MEIGSPNIKYFKDVLVNGTQVQGYVDFGSQICAIQDKRVPLLGLVCDLRDRENIIGYGGAKIGTLGAVKVEIKIDEVNAMTKIYVVPAECQQIPILIRHPFTEQEHVKVIKTPTQLEFSQIPHRERKGEMKTVLWAQEASVISNHFLGQIITGAELWHRE